MAVKIDIKDKRIIRIMEFNARMPISQLAKKIGVSRQVAEYRLRRLKQKGAVYSRIGVFDQKVVGINIFRVLFRLSNISPEKKKEFISYLRKDYPLMWFARIGNGWDLILNFMAKDSYAFDKMFMKITDDYGEYINSYIILIYINIYDMERRYIMEGAAPEQKIFFHEMGDNTIRLDEKDKEITKIISKDCSMSDIAIGENVGLTGNAVKYRLKRMQDNKFLLGYRMFIDPGKIGYQQDIVFLEINNLQSKTESVLYSYLKKVPNISFIVKHIGVFRIGFEIETRDAKELDNLITDMRNKFSHIINNVEIFPILEEFKIGYY